MSNFQFTDLQIQFSQNDKASVYYAHLQNIFKQLYQTNITKAYQKEEVLIKKVDCVLYDIFFEYQKLQKEYFSISNNLKSMLQQCAQMVNQCKSDREQLVKVTEDRQLILEKLKQSTDQSLEFAKQNSSLYQQLEKFKEINLLLNQKNTVLEEQIENVTTTNKSYQNVVAISKQFQKISNDNISIQKDIADILISTQIYSNASEPLQIMCLAFQQKPSLRDQLWGQILMKHKSKFQNIESTKQHFYNFNYIDALMLFTN